MFQHMSWIILETIIIYLLWCDYVTIIVVVECMLQVT